MLLTDGTELRCDVALVGIGVEPAAELVPGPIEGVPVFACGDVTGGPGHWTSAAAGAAAVARRILALPPQPAQPDFFWSDQFGLRLQLVGRADRGRAAVELEGTPEKPSSPATAIPRAGVVAALGANRPAEIASAAARASRGRVMARTTGVAVAEPSTSLSAHASPAASTPVEVLAMDAS